MTPEWIRDACDLVLGRACLGCHRPGPVLCRCCTDQLRGNPIEGDLDGVLTVSCGRYEGLLREAILSYKERGTRAMAPALAQLLATSVACADIRASGPSAPESTLVIPIPGHARAQRGFAALGDVVTHMRGALPTHLVLASALTISRDYQPVKGQGRVARANTVDGSMSATSLHPTIRRAILVDDVLTTGATMREGARALAHAGVQTVAIAVIASPGRPVRPHAPARATHLPKRRR